MTQLETTDLGTLGEPVPIPSLPFAQTIDVSERTARPGEPSPCLPSATSVWYSAPPRERGPARRRPRGLDAARPGGARLPIRLALGGEPTFLGCASPMWNAQLVLDVPVAESDVLLVQVGTSESRDGRLVVRVEQRRDGG